METRYDPKSGAHEAIPEGDEIFCKYIVFAISEILQRISGAESCIFSWWRLFEKSLPQEVDPTPLTQRFQPGKCCKLLDSEVHKCTIRSLYMIEHLQACNNRLTG